MGEAKQEFEYQAEMQKLLDILVHSLYTEREIFLRELISNASDALSKIQFVSLTDSNILDKNAELDIKVSFDEKEKTITVEDTGIGMDKDELMNNLGTIASSGTLKFINEMKNNTQNAENLIGQFGVGFYSVFMIAEKVELKTRSYKKGSEGLMWSSTGGAKFTLEGIDKKTRGTSITLFLKDEAKEFLNQPKLEGIIKKYSNYVPFPVKMGDNAINQVNAIWTQSKTELKKEEYIEFYKHISKQFTDPIHYMHLSIEAPLQYKAILYMPSEISNELLYSREAKGLSLYTQRVFIQADNKNLLPAYLRFVLGVVDSEDIPLNVSRENVQHNALIEKIQKSLTGRVLKELKTIAEKDTELYIKIWKLYGGILKEGISSDFSNKDKLVELIRFSSSKNDDPKSLTSFKEYCTGLPEDQKEIYYVVAPSFEAITHNPNLEYFKKNNLEVIYLTDHIDDFMMSDLKQYQGKTLKSISLADIDALKTNEDKKNDSKDKLPKEASDTLIAYFKAELGDRVKDVVASKRLVGSPCSLVNPQDGMSSHMEKLMKSVNNTFEIGKRNLELNMDHKIIKNLSEVLKTDKSSPFLKDCTEQLFQNAMLVEGLLDNPLEVLPRMYKFMEQASEYQVKGS